MGFFSDIIDGVGDLFSGGGGFDGNSFVDAAVNIGGAFIAKDANDDAAEKIAAAERERAAAIRAGNDAAQARFDQTLQLTQPSIDALTRIGTSDPSTLTPGQERDLEDARRQATNTFSTSGLRGSGRAVTAGIRDVESTFRNQAFDINRARKDDANRTLAGEGFAATGQAAGLDVDSGRVEGDAAAGAGNAFASAGLANANLQGGALADISSLISSEEKRRGRDSVFAKTGQQEEERV